MFHTSVQVQSFYLESIDFFQGSSFPVDNSVWIITDLRGDAKCVLCWQEVETRDYLLIHFPFSSFIWFKTLAELGLAWVLPDSIRNLLEADLDNDLGRRGKLSWVVVADINPLRSIQPAMKRIPPDWISSEHISLNDALNRS